MSNPTKGFMNTSYKPRGGKRGGCNDRRSNQHEQGNNAHGRSTEVSSPDDHEAGSTHSPSFQEVVYSGRKRSSPNQRRGNSGRGNRPVRPFNVAKTNDMEAEACQNSENASMKAEDPDTKITGEGGEKLSSKSCITEIEDDLFTASEDVSLAHCVAADFSMGSGIALKFRNEFGSVGELLDQRVGPGGIAFIRQDKKYVFYLVTKQSSKDKPTIDVMRQSLHVLHSKCTELQITKLAMPRIGCGLDEFSWGEVKPMLEQIFSNEFEISVYHLDREFSNTPQRKAKPMVKHEQMILKDIDTETALLYIGYEDSFISEEMKSLNERHPLLRNLKRPVYKPGTVFRTNVSRDYVIYGLICKKTDGSPLSYRNLESALNQLERLMNAAREPVYFEYFGLQAFDEKDDPFVMEKVETLIKNSQLDAEFWICWPPSLIHKRPTFAEQEDQKIEVKQNQNPPLKNRQSVSPNPSIFAKQSKDQRSNNWLPKAESRSNKKGRKSVNTDEDVKEVEEKLNAQSLTNVTETETSTVDPKSIMQTIQDCNTCEVGWEDRTDFQDIPDPIDNVQNSNDQEWQPEESWNTSDDMQSYAENERRKSREKQQAIQENKEKERLEKNRVKPKSCVIECKGDLFEAEDTLSLAHCVAADFRMGSGIAVLFRQQFGMADVLLDQRVEQGGVAYIQHQKRFVFYLVTKRESNGKPTYQTLERSLHALHEKCKELKVTELGMPRIGCGLDRLEWSEVKPMLERIFADGFTIRVFNLEKDYKETKQSMPKTTFKYENSYLKDIQHGTGLLYIGSVESFITEEMKSLDEKYPFLHRLSKDKAKLGSVVRTETSSYPKEVVYGLICKQSPNDNIKFVELKKALKELKKIIEKKDMYDYLGIQAFREGNDDNIMGKIDTMLRYSYIKAQAWICFPPSLVDLMPRLSSPVHITDTFGNGRSSWCESDNRRMAIMLRDMQRTQESMYRKLITLDDIRSEVFGPNGYSAKETEITSKLNQFGEEIHRQSTTIENLSKAFHSFSDSHKLCQDKIMTLEKRLEVIEKHIQSSTSEAQRRGHSLSRALDEPPPLVIEHHLGQPVFPNAGVCYNATSSVHPVPRAVDRYLPYMGMNPNIYPSNMAMFATQQFPEEFEALYRHTQEMAQHYGYKVVEKSEGTIWVQKNNNSPPCQIRDYSDLKSLENPSV